MTFIAKTTTHTVTTTPAENGGTSDAPSIRSIMLDGILNDRPKADTKALVEKHHPQSAGCKKFGVHYSWYKGRLKKEGLLPTPEMN